MRLLWVMLSLTSFAARAAPETFTSDFASRISFFSIEPGVNFDVSLDAVGAHCKTPCTLDAESRTVQLSVTRDGYTLTEKHLVPPGTTYVAIRPLSMPLLVAGVTLMSISATSLLVAAIFMLALPGWGILFALIGFGPAALLTGIPGVVFIALAPRRQTLQIYRGELQVP